jgi:hypothetical protein
MMTGNELLQRAAALFGDTNASYYAGAALPCINVLLAENFEQNNRLRSVAGLGELEALPQMGGLNETLPYENTLVYGAFSYGLAAKIFADDRDAGMLSFLHQQYVNAINDCDRGFVRAVRRKKEAAV